MSPDVAVMEMNGRNAFPETVQILPEEFRESCRKD